MNIRALTIIAFVSVLILAGCATPECITFRGQDICTGDSEQAVLTKLGNGTDVAGEGNSRVVYFEDRPPGFDFGTYPFVEITISKGKVRDIEQGRVHIDPAPGIEPPGG